MAADDHAPGADPGQSREPSPGEPAEQSESLRREDEVSWLGCLWLIVVPGVILAAVVIALNWLGC